MKGDCPPALGVNRDHRDVRLRRLITRPTVYRVGRKKRGHRLMTTILSILNRFKNYFFFTGRFLDKFAVKCISKIPSHLTYVATLPCEALMSAKQAINDKVV